MVVTVRSVVVVDVEIEVVVRVRSVVTGNETDCTLVAETVVTVVVGICCTDVTTLPLTSVEVTVRSVVVVDIDTWVVVRVRSLVTGTVCTEVIVMRRSVVMMTWL